MSRLDSRARAEEAIVLRGREWTWQEIADALGYRSRGAAQVAVARELARTAPESADTARRYLLVSAKYASRMLHDRLDAAYQRGDDDTVALHNRELCRNRDQIARLTGAYMPEKTELDVTVSTVEDTRRRLLARLERDTSALPALPVIDAEATEEAAT